MIANIFHSILLAIPLALGFGFVIFWHELGHFLAAKWAKVRVEQFAVGFGQAIFSWRKGLGFRWGSSGPEYEQLRQAESEGIQKVDVHAISPTEYRLNWIPLGGYVKMLGQDDLKPNQIADDPDSYNSKPVGKRMVIVSAGVIMNIILAAILFTYIYTVGIEVITPVVGEITSGSPATKTYRIENGKPVPAPLMPGDTIVTFNGRTQTDFEKIQLNTNLSKTGTAVPIQVRRANDPGKLETLYITPDKGTATTPFPLIGVHAPVTLDCIPASQEATDAINQNKDLVLPEELKLKPGDKITAADGEEVKDFARLAAIQQAHPADPLLLNVTGADGTKRTELLPTHFAASFYGGTSQNLAGMPMLVQIGSIQPKSPAVKKLFPGDIITAVADPAAGGARLEYPTYQQLLDFLSSAGEAEKPVRLSVLRNGKDPGPIELIPSYRIDTKRKGVGIGLEMADHDPVMAAVSPDSAVAAAGLKGGSTILAVNGKPVKSWLDVYVALRPIKAGQPFAVDALVDGVKKTVNFNAMSADDVDGLAQMRFSSLALESLQPSTYLRKVPTGQIWKAAWWGLDTRDAVLQVYLMIKSMANGSISAKEVSGPVGILTAGYKVAERGFTRLVWFLAIISANLAVMNFLPIPVVDGGLFTFLIIEKIKGGPVSQKVQAVAQYAGLALLLCVFVFATWQDILRIPFMF